MAAVYLLPELQIESESDNSEKILEIIKNYTDEQKEEYGHLILGQTAIAGNSRLLMQLLRDGILYDCLESEENYAFRKAIEYKQFEVAALLLGRPGVQRVVSASQKMDYIKLFGWAAACKPPDYVENLFKICPTFKNTVLPTVLNPDLVSPQDKRHRAMVAASLLENKQASEFRIKYWLPRIMGDFIKDNPYDERSKEEIQQEEEKGVEKAFGRVFTSLRDWKIGKIYFDLLIFISCQVEKLLTPQKISWDLRCWSHILASSLEGQHPATADWLVKQYPNLTKTLDGDKSQVKAAFQKSNTELNTDEFLKKIFISGLKTKKLERVKWMLKSFGGGAHSLIIKEALYAKEMTLENFVFLYTYYEALVKLLADNGNSLFRRILTKAKDKLDISKLWGGDNRKLEAWLEKEFADNRKLAEWLKKEFASLRERSYISKLWAYHADNSAIREWLEKKSPSLKENPPSLDATHWEIDPLYKLVKKKNWDDIENFIVNFLKKPVEHYSLWIMRQAVADGSLAWLKELSEKDFFQKIKPKYASLILSEAVDSKNIENIKWLLSHPIFSEQVPNNDNALLMCALRGWSDKEGGGHVNDKELWDVLLALPSVSQTFDKFIFHKENSPSTSAALESVLLAVEDGNFRAINYLLKSADTKEAVKNKEIITEKLLKCCDTASLQKLYSELTTNRRKY